MRNCNERCSWGGSCQLYLEKKKWILAGTVLNFPESLIVLKKKAIVSIVISNYNQAYKFLYITGSAPKSSTIAMVPNQELYHQQKCQECLSLLC